MKSIFTKEQIEYIKTNYRNMPYKEIADKFGMTTKQIQGKVSTLGLDSKRRQFDKHYFSQIDNNDKAYWLGFIYADGYIVDHELGIELKSNDDYLLKGFSKELGDVHPVEYKDDHKLFNGYEYDTHSCLIRVYSIDITNDLRKLNIVQNKTNSSVFPKCDDYFYAFLKGFLDGDGCLYVDNRNHLMVSFTNSNEDFLEYINKTVKITLGITGSIYKETDKKYKLIYFRKNDVRLLLDTIYGCNTQNYLLRKYNIYMSYYGFAA